MLHNNYISILTVFGASPPEATQILVLDGARRSTSGAARGRAGCDAALQTHVLVINTDAPY